MSGPWTEEEINRAADLWKQGFSASQIGRDLKRSRNAVCGVIDRNRERFKPRTDRGSGMSRKQRAETGFPVDRDGRSDAGLVRRIANQQSRDARNRERAVAKAAKLRGGTDVPEARKDDFDIGSVFAVDPSSGAKGDLSRFRLSEVKSVSFVDLKSGQCKLMLISFLEVAGPFSPCCGAETGDPLKPWCPVHSEKLRAA